MSKVERNQRYYQSHNKFALRDKKAKYIVEYENPEEEIALTQKKIETLSKRYYRIAPHLRKQVGPQLLLEIYYLQALLNRLNS